ncbi:hypothetical protein QWJ34_01050 [Saccharibacillus sp. CPCC 101409]|uniref:hypothetical protein n=1 Tax=Saccharibacillus sp. CPCC 101409 TaxID=3058041 RepID=UPI002673BD2B|nr:hypothetical protein [Saccharibacillus sp. CPCC 101409]MDO3408347.1 hypothetical protein [Saccharibacillus sp. CPCC 101409]
MDNRRKQLRLQQKMMFDVVFIALAIASIFYFRLYSLPGILLPLLLAALRGYTFVVNIRRFRRLSVEIEQEERESRLYDRD